MASYHRADDSHYRHRDIRYYIGYRYAEYLSIHSHNSLISFGYSDANILKMLFPLVVSLRDSVFLCKMERKLL